MLDLFKDRIQGSFDIGSSSLKGLRIKKGKVSDISIKELKNGVIVNGNIEDYLEISEGLKMLVDELELKNKEVVVSIPIQNFFIKFLSIGQVGEKEKLKLIESELEELVPNFEPEEFISDYVELGSELSDESKNIDGKDSIMAITVPKNKIKEILEIFDSLKVVPVRIVPDFISLFNLVQREKNRQGINEEESVMIVDMGTESTKIFIERDGIMKMQRIVATGGNDVTEMLQRFYNLEREQAEDEKRKLELLDESVSQGEEDSRALFMEIAELFDELENQIKVSIEFYKSHEGRPGIDKLFIFGGASLVKGFKQNLEKTLELEVEEIDYKDFLASNFNELYKVEDYPVARIGALLGSVVEEVKEK